MDEPYTPAELSLARDIANQLADYDSLDYHLLNARRFTKSFQQRILAQVLALPEHKINRSRAALCTYLITKTWKQQQR